MAGVRFAVADSLADGWSNPAKGAMLGASAVYSAPASYAIGRGGGHGVTLPFSALVAAMSAVVAFEGFDLQYGLRFTTGTSHPGTDTGRRPGPPRPQIRPLGNDFVTAPEGPLTLEGATVVTQQIWIGVPIH